MKANMKPGLKRYLMHRSDWQYLQPIVAEKNGANQPE
jgi:hypothetical protein